MTDLRRPGVGSPTAPARLRVLEPSVEALVEQAVDTALETLTRLDRQARRIARGWRARENGEARDGLRDLIAATRTLSTLASAAAKARGLDLAGLCDKQGVAPESATAALLDDLLRHERAGDGRVLAGTLEHHFIDVLDLWRQVLAEIGGGRLGPSGDAA